MNEPQELLNNILTLEKSIGERMELIEESIKEAHENPSKAFQILLDTESLMQDNAKQLKRLNELLDVFEESIQNI